ncbi:MAG TPA: MlaE family lipid ABC transporter permease subunit [Caulobacteraceae bacterium]|nr:MlaE family lipid ABC transporter permease subunit [Caulobacteraceae bacterium]
MQPADFRIDSRSSGVVVALIGDWTATALGRVTERLDRALGGRAVVGVDARELGRFDTAGAHVLLRAAKGAPPADAFKDRPEAARILQLVAEAERGSAPPRPRSDPVGRFLNKVGHGVAHFGAELYRSLAFQGHLLAAIGRVIAHPGRIRWAAWVSLMERAGLDAMPIIAVTTFFIGAVVAFLSADILLDFGASVFAVELIGIAVLREFSVVITAVLLAGRSASSFAAEIGAMKMNQEIDAMRVLGVDPFEALVLPRVMALLVMTPLLTFVADLAGLFGGALVVWSKLDLSPAFFLQRIEQNVGAAHFWVGMSKAPVFAVVVAAIGCRQGLSVGGDVESLGRRVTSAVVQAIFAIIALDAVFALLYLEAGR